jgi:hypothetical protein
LIRASSLVAALLFVLAALSPASARAQPTVGECVPTPEARAANERALELSKDGHFAEALQLFQEAYDACPSFVILYNIGRMSALTQDYARSLAAFSKYLSDGGSGIDVARRREVEGEIIHLKGEVSTIDVRTEETGAQVAVDGVVRGTTPLAGPIITNPGKRKITVSGKTTSTQEIDAKRGARVEVRFDGAPPDPVPVQPSSTFRFPSELVIAAWITAGVFTGASIATGVSALVTEADLNDDLYLGPAFTPAAGSEIEDKADRAVALATATDVLIGAAIVSGTLAILFTGLDAVGAPDEPEAKGEPAKPPAPTVTVLPTIGGLSITGSF